MKLLFGKSRKEAEGKAQEEKSVLFVCVEMQVGASWPKLSLENTHIQVI